MKIDFRRDVGQTNWIDHLLIAVGGSLALFSIAQGVSRPDIGLIFITAFLVGNLVAGFAGARLPAKWRRFDAVGYTLVALALPFTVRFLNPLFGDNPFVSVLWAAGFLAWILTIGSFFTWRDGTLLFQAVPCIAAFGLIGCFDIFGGVAFAFFGFLLCAATLFARVNARSMLDVARQSGAAAARETDTESSMERLRRGPWRVVAGPTWALGSAGAIVLLSLIGAPLVRESVKGVAGTVRLPMQPNRPQAQTPALFDTLGDSVRIGRGPISLSEDPVLLATLDQSRYLRSQAYRAYSGGRWSKGRFQPSRENLGPAMMRRPDEAGVQSMLDPEIKSFTIELLVPNPGALPVPGEVLRFNDGLATSGQDGSYYVRQGLPLGTQFKGTSAFPNPNLEPSEAGRPSEPMSLLLDTTGLGGEVVQLARNVTRDARTDYEKAMAIKREIASRVIYNQRAQAVPEGQEPIAYTLFQSREGYCDLYASAMVMMARSVGIPARYVTGYATFREERNDQGKFIVREKDGHAWAELWFRDAGWVIFDATEGAAEVEGAGVGDSTNTTPWYQTAWFLTTINIVIGVVVVGGAVAFWLVSRRERNRPDYYRSRVERSYAQYQGALRRASGRRRRPDLDPDEYLDTVRPSLNIDTVPVEELNRRFVRALYGPTEPGADEALELERETRRVATLLRSGK